jgi:hypothetical protein
MPLNSLPLPVLGKLSQVLLPLKGLLAAGTVKFPTPKTQANKITHYRDLVTKGRKLLPSRYHGPYLDVLEAAIEQVEKAGRENTSYFQLKAQMETLDLIFQELAAPILQLCDPQLQEPLKAHLALCSNLYQRFLSGRTQFTTRQFSPWLKALELDPLGFFSIEHSDPYTIVPSESLPISLVCKPFKQAHTPIFWVLDGHEVAGHAMHALIPGLTQELVRALEIQIQADFAQNSPKEKKPRLPKAIKHLIDPADKCADNNLALVKHLARTYVIETSADVIGLLNFGPMFANGLILHFLSKKDQLNLSPNAPLEPAQKLDAHPPALMRAILAIEVLQKLNFDNQLSYCSKLNERVKESFPQGQAPVFSFTTTDGSNSVEVSFDTIAALAGTIAETYLETKLQSIGNISLPQLMSWSKHDEKLAHQAAKLLLTGTNQSPEDMEARHIASGALLAAEQLAADKNASQTQLKKLQRHTLAMLKELYLEQCLLCSAPNYKASNRATFSISQLASSLNESTIR